MLDPISDIHSHINLIKLQLWTVSNQSHQLMNQNLKLENECDHLENANRKFRQICKHFERIDQQLQNFNHENPTKGIQMRKQFDGIHHEHKLKVYEQLKNGIQENEVMKINQVNLPSLNKIQDIIQDITRQAMQSIFLKALKQRQTLQKMIKYKQKCQKVRQQKLKLVEKSKSKKTTRKKDQKSKK